MQIVQFDPFRVHAGRMIVDLVEDDGHVHGANTEREGKGSEKEGCFHCGKGAPGLNTMRPPHEKKIFACPAFAVQANPRRQPGHLAMTLLMARGISGPVHSSVSVRRGPWRIT